MRRNCTILLVILFLIGFITYDYPRVKADGNKISMAYMYFGSRDSYISSVENANGALNEVSPDYFGINSDGSLLLTDKLDPAFIGAMHEKGIKVCPFISNHWDQLIGSRALQNRYYLAHQIANAIYTYNLDGIHVDIENMTIEDRVTYADFVRLLRELMPDRIIAVAVAANPNASNTGWHASYDYETLALYSDYLMIMAYDENSQGNGQGPVASQAFVEKSVIYALSKVPADKIVLGLPFYGRYWNTAYWYGGYGAPLDAIEYIISRYGGIAYLNQSTLSPQATLTIGVWDEKPSIYGRMLEAGTYNFYYEDAVSINAKLELVHTYGLRGAGVWSLGQESAGLWDSYKEKLFGFNYEPAFIYDHWASQYINNVISYGWMIGSTSGFEPDRPMTRAEAATILVRALGLSGEIADAPSFSDTVGHWAENNIRVARQYGLLFGKSDEIFDPNGMVIRKEMAVIIDRAQKGLGKGTEINYIFRDIDIYEDWSFYPIVRLSNFRIVQGDHEGYFHPNRNISRAEVATLFCRIAPYLYTAEDIRSGLNLNPTPTPTPTPSPDPVID